MSLRRRTAWGAYLAFGIAVAGAYFVFRTPR
jgi:hypothetical protein